MLDLNIGSLLYEGLLYVYTNNSNPPVARGHALTGWSRIDARACAYMLRTGIYAQHYASARDGSLGDSQASLHARAFS
jgi:hypothetical protein